MRCPPNSPNFSPIHMLATQSLKLPAHPVGPTASPADLPCSASCSALVSEKASGLAFGTSRIPGSELSPSHSGRVYTRCFIEQ